MLGDDVAGALSELRAHAESLMNDSAVCERKDGSSRDPVTGATVANWVPYRTTRCRLRTQLDRQTVEAGGEQITQQRMTAAVPFAVTDVRVGDRLTVTSADASLHVVYVLSVPRGTHMVQRRLIVSDVQE